MVIKRKLSNIKYAEKIDKAEFGNSPIINTKLVLLFMTSMDGY